MRWCCRCGPDVFTFGREHEKKCAAGYYRKPADPAPLLAIIDGVHDLIDDHGDVAAVRALVVAGFTSSNVRTWEGAGTWLRKAQADFPPLASAWSELAAHPQAEVRWRVAVHLDEMPAPIREALAPGLLADRSKRVREAARDTLASD